MITCSNGHPNADDSKFCESCGTKLEKDPVVVDLDTLDDASTTGAESEDAGDLGTDDQATTDDSVVVSEEDGLPDTAVDDIDPTDNDQTEDSEVDVDDDDVAAVDDVDDAALDSDDDGATDADQDDTDHEDDDDDQFVVPAPQTPILSVVAELETWASTNHVSNDPYVVGLSEAVRQRHDLGMWASIDPLLVLPEPRPSRVPLTQVIRWLAVVRNVLVFLPVALTWYAISKATDAYRDWDPRGTTQTLETGESVNIEKNFLDFWSNGYGVLDRKWTITEIGRLDFFIIMAIIVLALIISSLTSRAAAAEDAKLREADAQRTAIGIKIRRSLYGKRQASPSSIAESLADALSDLNETTRDMAEVASRLERSSAGVETLTPQLEALNATAAVFASQTSQAITNSVNSLVSSVDNLNTAVNANLTSVFESAVSNLQEAGEQLARTSASLEYGTKLLKDDIESIRKGLRR